MLSIGVKNEDIKIYKHKDCKDAGGGCCVFCNGYCICTRV